MASNRRQYSAEFKAKVVLQVLSGEKTPSDICRTPPTVTMSSSGILTEY